uniref:Zinc finger protein 365 n=1 Tax=Callorhinchus milii TaxID=7868 RepID=A0A4W3KIP9_CALMI
MFGRKLLRSDQEPTEHCHANLPYRCPRCGEHMRFRSLSSLRAHLEFSHSYETVVQCNTFSSVPQSSLKSSFPEKCLHMSSTTKHPHSFSNRNLHSNYAHCKNTKDRKSEIPQEWTGTETRCHLVSNLYSENINFIAPYENCMEERLQIVQALDALTEKRIDQLPHCLQKMAAQIAVIKAESAQLAQEKQMIQERERVLSTQVNLAIEMIIILKQKLAKTEQELHAREQEAADINQFLQAAVQKEARGKVKVQRFIEGLLHRIAVAEKQLQEYHEQQGLFGIIS